MYYEEKDEYKFISSSEESENEEEVFDEDFIFFDESDQFVFDIEDIFNELSNKTRQMNLMHFLTFEDIYNFVFKRL